MGTGRRKRRTAGIVWWRLLLFTAYGTAVSCLLDPPALFTAIMLPIMTFGYC